MKGSGQMAERKVSNKSFKPVCSISYLCKSIVGLSRAQFYNLQRDKIFPPAQTDEKSGRKYFTLEQQKECFNIRSSGIAYSGEFYLFYEPRSSSQSSFPQKKPAPKADTKSVEIMETLNQMGLDVKAEQVAEALKSAYPEGYESVEEGLLVRNLFRILKQNG
jgi:hypothetical protein